MRLVRLADQGKMPLAAPRGAEPVAHYKFASFARFRCARQKMSQSFNRLHTHTQAQSQKEMKVEGREGGGAPRSCLLCLLPVFLLGLNVSFCLGSHAKKYAETMSSIICIEF